MVGNVSSNWRSAAPGARQVARAPAVAVSSRIMGALTALGWGVPGVAELYLIDLETEGLSERGQLTLVLVAGAETHAESMLPAVDKAFSNRLPPNLDLGVLVLDHDEELLKQIRVKGSQLPRPNLIQLIRGLFQ